MTVKYLLPCTCGREIPVTTTQAGAAVPCPCGQTLPVPTLLRLKQLPQVRAEEPQKQAALWTPLQGGVFVVGALVALAALATAGYFAWERSKLQTAKPVLPSKSDFISDTRRRNVDDLWQLWDALSDPQTWPQRRRMIPLYVVHREADRVLRTYLYVTAGVALAGVALSCSSFFIRSSPGPQKRRRPNRPPPNRGPG